MAGQNRQIQVRTNTFKLLNSPNYNVHLHQVPLIVVDFNPTIAHARDRRTLMHRLQSRVSPDDFGKTSPYDGNAQLFAQRILPTKTYLVPKHQRDIDIGKDKNPSSIRVVEVTIKYLKTFSAKAIMEILRSGTKSGLEQDVPAVITFLNVAIKHGIFLRELVQTKRAFFPHGPNGQPISRSLNHGLEIWTGVYLSVRLTNSFPVLNTDLAHTVMMEGGRLDNVMMQLVGAIDQRDITRHGQNGKTNRAKLGRLLKHVEVRATYTTPQKRYKIRDIILEGADCKFQHPDGEISVADYFRKTFNWRADRPAVFAAKVSKTAVIPAQLLEVISGQPFRGALQPETVSRILDFTKVKPDDRLRRIVENSQGLDYRNSPALRDNQIHLQLLPWQLPALELAPPELLFGSGPAPAKEGRWDLMNKRISKRGSFAFYVVVYFTGARERLDMNELRSQIKTFHNVCIDIGIRMPAEPPILKFENAHCDVGLVLKSALEEATVKAKNPAGRPLIIAIIPENSQSLKDAIKRAGDIDLGAPTHIHQISKKFLSAKDQYFRLAALKLNVRGGGYGAIATSPAIRKLQGKPTMVIGADVSHASPGSLFPSIAALVGSIDKDFVKYIARWRVQPARVERIEEIGEMITELLKACNSGGEKWLPQRIVFFRDGLSEGEFKVVADKEKNDMKEAIRTFWEELEKEHNDGKPLPPLPKLIYITAIKNHHIRLTPAQGTRGDRSGNVFAGTATKEEFAQPNSHDFFLVSHKGLLGTSRPTHYNVLVNEDSEISVHDLMSFSNGLCYDFARATCAVSQVTPVYYAHLVCKRGRIHLSSNFHEDPSEITTNASEVDETQAASELYQRVKHDWRNVNRLMANEMYFL